jgi:hypothetical protein
MKPHKIFLALLFLLAVVIGCDGDGGSNTPPELLCQQICPCDFLDVPMTEECWSNDPNNPNIFDPGDAGSLDCQILSPESTNFATRVIVERPFGNNPAKCEIDFQNFNCCPLDCGPTDLNTQEFEACISCLEQYATELNASGFPVKNEPPASEPSYMCNIN